MTLTEFLLARIADDRGRIVHEFDCDRFEVYDYGTRYGDCDCEASKQLWAGCEAKRRIVDLHRLAAMDCCETCGFFPPRLGGCMTLRILALPYADHPDYREEWKP